MLLQLHRVEEWLRIRLAPRRVIGRHLNNQDVLRLPARFPVRAIYLPDLSRARSGSLEKPMPTRQGGSHFPPLNAVSSRVATHAVRRPHDLRRNTIH